ncbi:hypothetical protein B0J14DRAFT_602339 [Halenospora varia]|nr:hypothetical protein B0J14DRAFT_602339 [Halenospora varia]
MTLVVIVVLIVFIVSFVTVTPFLDFVCCSASRYWEVSLVSASTFNRCHGDYSVPNDTSESRLSNGDVSIQIADGLAV